MFDSKDLKDRLSRADPFYYTLETCEKIASRLNRIAELKAERNAVILAHNYQRPEIFEIADFTGDSLGLSLSAAEVKDADVIVFCGVHFMAETAKVVSPSKKVILPNLQAGCSLADTADAEDVRARIAELREQYPDLGVVCYVNTTAAVKAQCDACCTSANAVEVIRAMPNDVVLYIPDENMAAYASKRIPEKTIIPWEGNCYVHHEITAESVQHIQEARPDMKVLVHPECREDVIKLADAALSTSGMIDFARNSDAVDFLAVTECGLSDLLMIEVPDKHFFRACKICRFMKMITLDNIILALETLQPEVILPEDIRAGAERSIKRMFELTSPEKLPEALVVS
ncbi:MAG: quinolinate synthase NadA [Calditrichaeota bacterium]|nr:quinolinate synthase NadA [Calditrichota bacterium]